MAVYTLVDPVSGFAPLEIQLGGLGKVMLARTDGEDFTSDDMVSGHSLCAKSLTSFFLDATFLVRQKQMILFYVFRPSPAVSPLVNGPVHSGNCMTTTAI